MSQSPFRKTIFLSAVLVVLLIIVVFFTGEGKKQERREAAESTPVLSAQQVSNIDSIVFQKPGKEAASLSLTMADSLEWKVGNYDVDSDLEVELTEALQTLPRGKRISRNQENWPNYGLSPEMASQVLFKDGETVLLTLYLGSPGSAFGTVNVRRDENPEVFLINSPFKSFAAHTEVTWRDKSFFSHASDDVSQMNVRIGEERWTFVKDGDWRYVSDSGTNVIPDQESFESYVSAILDLGGNGIEPDASLFKAADNAVSLTLNDGEEYVVMLDITDDERYLVQLSGAQDLITVSSDLSAQLRPSMALSDPGEVMEETPEESPEA